MVSELHTSTADVIGLGLYVAMLKTRKFTNSNRDKAYAYL